MKVKFLCKTVKAKTFFFLLLFASISLNAQTNLITELSGDPLDLSEWTTNGVDIEGEEIVLTQAAEDEKGALFYAQPYDLNQCVKWKIEFDFRMYDGNEHADGLAFWYLENPPENFGTGGDIGMPADSYGLKVVFDTYDNDNYDFTNHNPNPEIQVYYGEGYSEENSIIPHDNMLLSYWPGLVDEEYQRAVISWDNGQIEITIDGEEALSGEVEAFNGVENIEEGYFGFSASTGLYYDRHSIKNVKVYNNAIDLEEEEFEIAVCDESGEGFSSFDLTQIEDEIEADIMTMFFYYLTEEDAISGSNIITNPTDFINEEEGGQTIYVRVENQEGCYSIAEINLLIESAPTSDLEEVTLNVCVTAEGEETLFDLTQAEDLLFEDHSDLNFLYFESTEEAENGENNIANIEDYITEEETTVYVKVYGLDEDCYTIYPIHLQYDEPPVIENIEDIQVCGNEDFTFDLTQNENLIIGEQENVEVNYFETEESAISGENPIENPQEYNTEEIGCTAIFVRIELETDSACFSVAEFQVCGVEIEVETPNDLVSCEIDFYDNAVVFDLTENTTQILTGQNPEDFQVYFYNTLEDAETGENEISVPENYETDQNEIIYFRAENTEECFAVGSFELIIIETTIIDIEGVEVCENEKVNLFEITSNEDIEIIDFYASLEDFAEGINISSPEEYELETNSTAIYIKVIESAEDCAVLYKVQLTSEDCAFFIPEGFSPNGDGKNDFFEISGLENHNYTLKVYSRYGVLLYEGNQDTELWDGSSKNGNKVPSGVYYYVLKSDKIEKPIKGWVYLNR